MGFCQKNKQTGEHRFEFREDRFGETWFVCLDCGEWEQQFADHQGC